jgi:hypothetical protein
MYEVRRYGDWGLEAVPHELVEVIAQMRELQARQDMLTIQIYLIALLALETQFLPHLPVRFPFTKVVRQEADVPDSAPRLSLHPFTTFPLIIYRT